MRDQKVAVEGMGQISNSSACSRPGTKGVNSRYRIMSDKNNTPIPSNAEKDPDDWVTGDKSMTGAQASYLKTLCEEAGEPFDDSITKAEASRRIDAMQAKTGRGRTH